MPEAVPLVEAMKLIRTWPWANADQSGHIDMLIEALLIERYPSPEWIISLDRDSRTIRVAHWTQLERDGAEWWTINPESARDVDCAELEAAGVGWLALAESQIP